MKCECCGREKEVLVEIGAVSPKVATTGKCCLQCCMFILASLEDEREEVSNRRAEFLPMDEEQAFVDGRGYPVGKEKLRFGMTDAEGRKHFFCVERIEHIPEMASYEIYPQSEGVREDRTEYDFRTFGMGKSDGELLGELLDKMETALLNPVIETDESAIPEGQAARLYQSLRMRGYVQIECENGEICFRIDGRLYSAREFAKLLDPYEGFHLTYQIRDATEPVPDRDTYYMPVRISDGILLEELEILILTVSGGRNFISYRDTAKFSIGFDRIYDKLELYCRSNPPGAGKIAGLKLIERLQQLETDDDIFPEVEVECIRNLIGEY